MRNTKKAETLLTCVFEHEDCAANKGGVCLALSDMNFKKADCPFYKSREQNERECEKCRLRLGLNNLNVKERYE